MTPSPFMLVCELLFHVRPPTSAAFCAVIAVTAQRSGMVRHTKKSEAQPT